MPGRQADGFFEETELGVVEAESLVDDVRGRLHVHLADGHGLAVFCFERYLQANVKSKKYQQSADPPP